MGNDDWELLWNNPLVILIGFTMGGLAVSELIILIITLATRLFKRRTVQTQDRVKPPHSSEQDQDGQD